MCSGREKNQCVGPASSAWPCVTMRHDACVYEAGDVRDRRVDDDWWRWCGHGFAAAAHASSRTAAGDRSEERRRRADISGDESLRGTSRQLRRPRRRLRGAARAVHAARNPSDNSLAVGPDHIVQIVNSRMAIFTKKGKKYDTTGQVLYGPVTTNNVFAGFGGPCEARNNGDAVVRYDQLADRWLIVMPIFATTCRPDQPRVPGERRPPSLPHRGSSRRTVKPATPGPAAAPPPNPAQPPPAGRRQRGQQARRAARRRRRRRARTPMCYAVSTSADPLGRTIAMHSIARSFRTIRDRRSGPTATTCRRAPATTSSRSTPASSIARRCSKGEPATRAVRHHRRRQLSQQRRHRRQGAAAARRAEHHDGGRRHAARRRSSKTTGIYAWKFHVDWEKPAKTAVDRPVEDRRRAVSLSVRRPADQLRAAAGTDRAPRRAGRQDHGAPRLPARRRPRVDRRRRIR